MDISGEKARNDIKRPTETNSKYIQGVIIKMLKRKVFYFVLISFLTVFGFSQHALAYPGSGQAKWEEAEIQIIEELSEVENITETGIMVNPLMKDPKSFEGESAVFGNSCLTCHGGDQGAHMDNQPYHGAITVDLIRIADNKSMVQEDGSLLIEVNPNGGVTKYKLVVGLSEEVYDGGYEDDRALAGWHFSLPKGIHMDLPYCMHIIGPNLSKVYPENQNAVFSDINVAADENFEEKKGILQIISGTQNATPNDTKTYGSVVVEYKYSEDAPVEEGVTVYDFPSPTAPGPEVQQASVAVTPDSDENGSAATYVYYIVLGAIVLALILFFFRRKSTENQA